MTIYFTADHHFGHKNILKYEPNNRPFKTIKEHDEFAISQWNSRVRPDDTVYHLGDFSLGDKSVVAPMLENLSGKIYFVPGGHDYRWLEAWESTFKHWRGLLLLSPLYSLEIDQGKKHPLVIVLCHYAMRVWDRSHYGSLHLFGHSHGRLTIPHGHRSMDVGVDTNNFKPYSLDEVVERLSID